MVEEGGRVAAEELGEFYSEDRYQLYPDIWSCLPFRLQVLLD